VDRYWERRQRIFKYMDEHPYTPFDVLDQLFQCDTRKLLKRHKPELYDKMVKAGCGKRHH